jgi:hypothetical protein
LTSRAVEVPHLKEALQRACRRTGVVCREDVDQEPPRHGDAESQFLLADGDAKPLTSVG